MIAPFRIATILCVLMVSVQAKAAGGKLALLHLGDVRQHTRTEIRLDLKTQGGIAPFRFTIAKVRKGDAEAAIPANLKLDAAKGTLSWTPTESQAGTYELEVQVRDAKDQVTNGKVRIEVQAGGITTINGKVGNLLRRWYAEGSAAGNTGDFYDNRDRDHSPLNTAPWPQLDRIVYTEEQQKKRTDWAAQHTLLPQVTFGNSSTSAPVLFGGSNIRLYYVHPRGTPFLYSQYRGNNLYMYPGHHDHHPGHNGKPFYGDVFPANTPYLIGSQGSSGTDQPFMHALPVVLAAFRPEVKKKLRDNGLLMPTVQMIFRSCNKHLKTPDEYLTGKAHPSVFEGSWVDDLKMVQAAHDLDLSSLPPLVQLRVVEEDAPVDGRDYFEGGKSEKLFDTPAAIARVVRGRELVRSMVVSAEESFDVDKKPLKYLWVVLRGDPRRIQIRPRNETQSIVELLVQHHERRDVPDAPFKIASNRVDIGMFVHNGTHYSAPGFVTFFSIDSEMRTYDRAGRVSEIGYGAGETELKISDWNQVFETVLTKAPEWPRQLLQEKFSAKDLTELRKVAEEYRTASTKSAELREKNRLAQAARKQTDTALQKAETRLKAAQQLLAQKPSADNETAVKAALAARDASAVERKKIEADANAAQKDADQASRALDAILTSIRDRFLSILERYRDDPDFAAAHHDRIELLLAAADPGTRARFENSRKHWLQLGLFQLDGKAFVVHKSNPFGGWTPYELMMLQRYHAEVLGLIFPKFLTHNFTPNFVDQRLAARKEWRDIYHYDSTGQPIGWTRFDVKGQRDFTSDGLLVLEKDERGRARKAQSVRYVPDLLQQNTAIHGIKEVPGDRIVHLEYDVKGKASIREVEKVPEKK